VLDARLPSVAVTAYNRPDGLARVLDDLEREGLAGSRVHIYDDAMAVGRLVFLGPGHVRSPSAWPMSTSATATTRLPPALRPDLDSSCAQIRARSRRYCHAPDGTHSGSYLDRLHTAVSDLAREP